MKVGFFANTFNQFASLQDKYDTIAWNTGNVLFLEAIKKTIECDVILSWEDWRMSDYDGFITTELIWIQEKTLPSQDLLRRLKEHPGKPIIPISVGLQAHEYKPDFSLQPEMVAALKDIESRCRIAVRGAFTADILRAHGVRDIEIIGCPSLYQIPLYAESLDFLLAKRETSFSIGNYRSFDGEFTAKDRLMLRYISCHCAGFMEQTLLPLTPTLEPDDSIRQWFDRHTQLFFDLESWVRHTQRYDFSFGLRFHGNVAALLAKVPALFLTFDSRTTEMTEFFSLPSLPLSEFSSEIPLYMHAEGVDYSPFMRTYKSKIDAFKSFVAHNNLNVSRTYNEKLAAFRF